MDFDTEKFIMEVYNRPAIWKYTDKIKRFRHWNELAESYGAQTDDEVKKISARLQKKWKNIRDCFVKTHKFRTGHLKAGRRKVEYAFYDQLLFLLESECLIPNNDDSNDTSSNYDGVCVKIEPLEHEPSSSNDSWKRPKIEFEVDSIEPLKKDDDAQLFFLSLVKEFNKVPEHLRIQTKIDILKVIKDAQFSDN